AGRWHLLPPRDLDPTRRAATVADALLDRHGVVTRGAVMAEGHPGGFASVYTVLSALEERGAARRGYFVEGLGAAQFALPGAVDRLRAMAEPDYDKEFTGRPADTSPAAPSALPPTPPTAPQLTQPPRESSKSKTRALVLAATDPANPYGAALSWPATDDGHRPGRKAGALVVLVNGELVMYVERGGRTVKSFVDDETILTAAAHELAAAVKRGALGVLSVERADGDAVIGSVLGKALENAGFKITPRGLRLRA
ncbi:Lhr family helicase, partial [Allorhizocola rhizosphaerae]|uniref:Lhr family helicase n=1 Tax=Allorhizocola rhizosphaerae TaxID=1872709 RepID=UPI003CCC49C9